MPMRMKRLHVRRRPCPPSIESRGNGRSVYPAVVALACCLTVGALLNVIIAWGVAMSFKRSSAVMVDKGEEWVDRPIKWFVRHKEGPGFSIVSSHTAIHDFPIRSQRNISFIPSWSDIEKPDTYPTQEGRITGREVNAFGWPYRALKYEVRFSQPPGSLAFKVTSGVLLRAPSVVIEAQALPTGLIPTGFLCNTLIFGLVLWLGWFTKAIRPFTLLRRSRIRRGRCPACGYLSKTESPVCPECGSQLPSCSEAMSSDKRREHGSL